MFPLDREQKKIEKIGLTELGLKLVGVVTDVDKIEGYNGFGFMKLKILSTNIINYDPRNKLEFYYCIIKDSIAKIYDSNINECFVNDTIEIDTKKATISWKNIDRYEQIFTISINADPRYWEYIKEHHQKD